MDLDSHEKSKSVSPYFTEENENNCCYRLWNNNPPGNINITICIAGTPRVKCHVVSILVVNK
uniref:Uncharacterized protein n=1 Tax=Glossina brevipalpis TaxID=37001 RepID=A0A1A9WS15_9MUSC